MLTLSDFTPEHNALAKEWVEAVMVHDRRDIRIDPDQAEVMAALIAEGPENVAKILIAALAAENATRLIPLFEDRKSTVWHRLLPPQTAAKWISQCPVGTQKELLAALLKDAPETYSAIKSAMPKTAAVRVGNTFVTRVKADALISTRIDKIIALLLDPNTGLEDVKAEAESLRTRFDLDQGIEIAAGLVKELQDQKLGLSKPSDFKIHVKLHHLSATAPDLFGAADWTYFDDVLIQSLGRMPDTEWIFKVLNQLPVFTIRRVLTVIHEQLSHSEFSRRNLAARLLKEIRSDVDTDKFENVRLAIISTTFNASSAT